MDSIKKPIRILFISHTSGLYGAERSLLLLLKNINRKNYQLQIVLPKKGELVEEIRKLNIKTHIINNPWWVGSKKNIFLTIPFLLRCILIGIMTSFRLCRIIKNEDIDIIYTNTITIFSGAVASFITNKPHIWHIREIITNDSDLSFYINRIKTFQFIFNRSVKIITNSKATADQFYNIKSKDKISIIHNAVDINIFKKTYSFPKIKTISPEDWITTVIGTLSNQKAQDDAIYAIKLVSKQIPNIKLIIIGEGNKYKAYLEKITKNLEIEKNILIIGFRNDIPDILNHCKVLLVPSLNESFGRVVIEGMAASIPVIGANCGGVREIIEDDVTGYLIPPNSPDKIAEKILYLYKHPNIAINMGLKGKKVVKQKFSVDKYINNIEKVINAVMRDKYHTKSR